MFVTGFPAAAFATNCFVLATGEGQECLVVDPGYGVVDRLEEVLREHRLKPVAIILTHGHFDHVFSVTPVGRAHGMPAYVHRDDAYRLEDPVSKLGAPLRAMLERELGPAMSWEEPDDLRLLTDQPALDLAGMSFGVRHAPGHTEGSVMFTLDLPPGAQLPGADVEGLVLAGDVLFAGSIGRTDLEGGSLEEMMRSLREQVLTLADDTLVLPGHGPATTIGRERSTNPYLVEAAQG